MTFMTSKFFWRRGASFGVLLALTAGPLPALADTNLSVTLGGFLAAEGIYRSRDEQADVGSTFSGVPFSNAATAHTSELRETARQSRLSILVQGNADSDTHLAMYGEFDFMAAPQSANSNESNSYSPRIRNLYGTVDWDALGLQLLAGQSWSLVTLNSKGITPRNEVPPATIEAQYAVGFNWARQPQIRITKNWNKDLWLAVSIENPQTTFAPNAAAASGITVTNLAAGGPEFDKTNNFSLNHVPDVVGKIAWEPMIDGARPLHIELLGVYRSFYDRINIAGTNGLNLPASIHNANISGGGIGGSVTYTAIPQLLDLQVTAMNGQGIGRYGSGQLPDVTFKPSGELAPITETTALAGATLHASPFLDIYGYAGQEADSAKYYNVGTAHLGLGNPAYNLAGCFTEGGACSPNLKSENQADVGFWWKAYQGGYGSFRFGMQYSYTHLSALPGAGGRPTTDDSMVFTSIRYYPF